METIKVTSKLIGEERETILNYDSISKMWIMDSFIGKHYRKALNQGWTPLKQYVYEDGTVCGMMLTAPGRSITIRNTNKKVMSDKQMENLNCDNFD